LDSGTVTNVDEILQNSQKKLDTDMNIQYTKNILEKLDSNNKNL